MINSILNFFFVIPFLIVFSMQTAPNGDIYLVAESSDSRVHSIQIAFSDNLEGEPPHEMNPVMLLDSVGCNYKRFKVLLEFDDNSQVTTTDPYHIESIDFWAAPDSIIVGSPQLEIDELYLNGATETLTY